MTTIKYYLPLFLSGILLAFAYPNFINSGFIGFALFSYIIFYQRILNTNKLKNILISTLIFSLGFSQFGFYWLAQTLSTFGEINLIWGHIAALFFSLIVLPQLWPQVILSYFLKKKISNKLFIVPILCTSHVIFEAFMPTQFPVWLGHSILTFNTSLPMADIFGAGYYSFALLCLILPFSWGLKNLKFHKYSCILGFLMILMDIVYGRFYRHESSLTDYSKKPVNVRIVQANIGNFLKIESERGSSNSVEEVFKSFNDLTFLPSNKQLDLIIWPETAIPTLFNTDYWQVYQFTKHAYIKNIIDQLSPTTSLVFGGYDEGHLNQSANNLFAEYNTAFFYQNFNLESYYKIKLIPFGETLPFGSLNAELAPFFPGVSLFSQGSQYRGFALQNGHTFITPICYEILDTNFIRNFLNNVPKANFIVNITNDSWYGDTAEPWQHLFLARWRALEFRIPIVRATNTGISVFIDENGHTSEYLGIHEKNVLDKTLYLHRSTPTLYQRTGLIPIICLMLILDLALIYCYRRRKY